MQADEIKKMIEEAMTNTRAYVEGDGTHFSAQVISPDFVGKSRLQKQQLVYNAVRLPLMDGTLHALSLKTFTEEEWQAIVKQNHVE